MVRLLDAVVKAQGAQVGVLLILKLPTKPMVDWARQTGSGRSGCARLRVLPDGAPADRDHLGGDALARPCGGVARAAQ